jgi:hypothetical protein
MEDGVSVRVGQAYSLFTQGLGSYDHLIVAVGDTR